MSASERLSDKINEIYDMELIEEFSEIFNDVVDEYKELSDAYKRERVKLKALKNCLDVKREAYQRNATSWIK